MAWTSFWRDISRYIGTTNTWSFGYISYVGSVALWDFEDKLWLAENGRNFVMKCIDEIVIKYAEPYIIKITINS